MTRLIWPRLIWTTMALSLALSGPLRAQDTPQPDGAPQEAGPEAPVEMAMTLPRLWEIIQALDPEAVRVNTRMQLTVSDVPVLIVTDPRADRMRAMVPIRSAEDLTAEELRRVMQANFDTALDARYAIANDRLWGVFIHPLSALERDQFLSGLGQTVNIALSYGKSYSGGAMIFGGGDEGARQRALLQELLRRGQDI